LDDPLTLRLWCFTYLFRDFFDRRARFAEGELVACVVCATIEGGATEADWLAGGRSEARLPTMIVGRNGLTRKR
jgi:hypothetical protein